MPGVTTRQISSQKTNTNRAAVISVIVTSVSSLTQCGNTEGETIIFIRLEESAVRSFLVLLNSGETRNVCLSEDFVIAKEHFNFYECGKENIETAY